MLNKAGAAAFLAALSFLSSSCAREQAVIPPGCYRFEDGQPLFTVAGDRGTFKIRGDISWFQIGTWRNGEKRELTVRPAFYLHDGRATAPFGTSHMPLVENYSEDGYLQYGVINRVTAIGIPVEAYGHEQVRLAAPC